MAVPTTKATFKSYCLRALGFGVIDINISPGPTFGGAACIYPTYTK